MLNDDPIPLFHRNHYVAGTPSRCTSGPALYKGEILALVPKVLFGNGLAGFIYEPEVCLQYHSKTGVLERVGVIGIKNYKF